MIWLENLDEILGIKWIPFFSTLNSLEKFKLVSRSKILDTDTEIINFK